MIELEEVETALKLKSEERKVEGPTGVVVEMLRAGGKGCLESLTRIFNEVFENKLPDKWMLS